MRLLITLALALAACKTPASKTDADEDGSFADVDCDDTNADVHPGATEACNEVDDNCDGDVDEAGATGSTTFYADGDGDGFGSAEQQACSQPSGAVTESGDCDDQNAAVSPDAAEMCNDVDDDCDGDVDGGAADMTRYYADTDGDAFGDPTAPHDACEASAGYVEDDTDCDDTSDAAHPGGVEICDTLDNDCDGGIDEAEAADAGTWYEDADGDGAGDPASSVVACEAPEGYVGDDTDCHPETPAYVDCSWDGPVMLTTCGQTGYAGPSQAVCDTEYAGTALEGMVTVSGGIQSWVVPWDGTFEIAAYGGQGASATMGSYEGGYGAESIGTFDLTAGTVIEIAVGQAGSVGASSCNGGGGGGTFVVSDDTPMVVAGGGGGTRTGAAQNGCDAVGDEYGTTASGASSTGGCEVKTTEYGVGGVASSTSWGSAGAGFDGDGGLDAGFSAVAAKSWDDGLAGGYSTGCDPGDDGGFGGGGSGSGCCGGGGGGGYSGGDGGWIAGGGGSYNAGSSGSTTGGTNTGDGWVVIDWVH